MAADRRSPFRQTEQCRLCAGGIQPSLRARFPSDPRASSISRCRSPHQPAAVGYQAVMDSSELEEEVGERAQRVERERESDDVECSVCWEMTEKKQAVSVCVSCGSHCERYAVSCWLRRSLAFCSSHPISSLTDCPDPALLC